IHGVSEMMCIHCGCLGSKRMSEIAETMPRTFLAKIVGWGIFLALFCRNSAADNAVLSGCCVGFATNKNRPERGHL
ncbi:MAG TPA: hypothetical protein PKC70_02925, partial [Cellvibrionaceae bacterium]|nr:hypothetical protein [Cellvibrionaceae bacterium]